jgi:hypothetical protein
MAIEGHGSKIRPRRHGERLPWPFIVLEAFNVHHGYERTSVKGSPTVMEPLLWS